MKKVLLLFVALLVLAIAGATWWVARGPDLSQFAGLRDPRLTRMNAQRMLVVEAAGDPNVVAGAAFKVLFDRYYELQGVPKMAAPPAPRARWRLPLDARKDQWVGQYALPLPDSAAAPSTDATSSGGAKIMTWTYGDVAEILHEGPYSTETPDIERLNAFIHSEGYRVVGDHEEEYVKGPGRIFGGNPDKYLTIIRLRVEPVPETRR